MPYLKITCAGHWIDAAPAIAKRLTDEINDLFYNPRSPTSREELRERTTVQFAPYTVQQVFIGGATPEDRGMVDVTVELSDWSMSKKQQRKVAHWLTPVLAEIFDVPLSQLDNINIRFHSYPPSQFAVGGILLSDRVPWAARWAKRLFG